MAAIRTSSQGRDFTAEELIGKHVRIECPDPGAKGVPVGYFLTITADGERVNNICKLGLMVEPDSIIEVKLLLCHRNQTAEKIFDIEKFEEVTLRDNLELSFSAIASEVQ